MKKIVMAATLLSIVTGGEVSALAAKTQHSVAKITHVKVTKHKVTGYTTAQSHIKLMKLKHGEKVSATANKHGKFTLKVKSNNLTKLKFKLKATKTGLKARTYTHKVKKAVQSIDDGATTETQTAPPATVKPDSSSADKKPEKKHDTPKYVVVDQSYSSSVKTITRTLKDAQKKIDDIKKEQEKITGHTTEINSLGDQISQKTAAISALDPDKKKAEIDTLTKDKEALSKQVTDLTAKYAGDANKSEQLKKELSAAQSTQRTLKDELEDLLEIASN
ncbi:MULTISPECIES: hypothetical protein [Levilactobacillus]